jgi:hypothetical protein
MAAKSEEGENIITVSDRNNSTDTRASDGMDEAAEKLSKDSLDKPECEDESPTMLFKMHEEKLSSRMNYTSMLEGEWCQAGGCFKISDPSHPCCCLLWQFAPVLPRKFSTA